MMMLNALDNLFMLASSAAAEHTSHGEVEAITGNAAADALMWIVRLGMITVTVGMLLCLYRMLKGPHLADRVLAGDTLAMHVVAFVVLLAIAMRTTIFFDAVLVVAIIGFASTLAFAQYIGAAKHDNHQNGGAPS